MIYTRIDPERSVRADFFQGLVETIDAVGTDGFAQHFSDLIFQGFNVTEFLVFQRSEGTGSPVILFSNSIDNLSVKRAQSYCDGFYRQDPIYSVLDASNPDGTYAIRVRAEEIVSASFRNICYTQPGLVEKLTLARKAEGNIIAISVFGREADGGFDAAQISELNHFGNLLLPVLNLHFRLTGNNDRPNRVSAQEMEDYVAKSFPELTEREVAVCARSVLGVTAEGIALELGIKKTSVLTYRRRAYSRLNINSINQLSTMMIQPGTVRTLAAA